MTNKLKSVMLGIAFGAFSIGFAYAMPHMLVSASQSSEDDPAVEATHIDDDLAASPDPSETEVEEQGSDDPDGEKADNHGSAVSTAAHCDVKGRAHGELVRSIAHDKDATVADAEAACAAAMAAAATGDSAKDKEHGSKGKSDEAHGNSAEASGKGNPHKDDQDASTTDAAGDEGEEGQDDEAETSDDDSGTSPGSQGSDKSKDKGKP